MIWEIWFSEKTCSTTVFARGFKENAGTFESDARLIHTFEAETVDEVRAYKDSYLYGPGGFHDQSRAG
jgi:hypothetical protein